MTRHSRTQPDAYSRDGHPVEIVRSHFEDGVEFAVVRYLDGHMPGPVGGRVSGTEDDPLWEHRVKDGKVLRSGGDYYNEADWIIERGLQNAPARRPQRIVIDLYDHTPADEVADILEDLKRIGLDDARHEFVDERPVAEPLSRHDLGATYDVVAGSRAITVRAVR